MGYRCPRCKKDFGHDRDAFQKHLSDNLNCAVEATSIFHDTLENAVKEHKEFSLEEEKEGDEKMLITDALDKIQFDWKFPLDQAIYVERTWGHGRLQKYAIDELSKRLALYLFENDFIELKEETTKNEFIVKCYFTFVNKKKLRSDNNKECENE